MDCFSKDRWSLHLSLCPKLTVGKSSEINRKDLSFILPGFKKKVCLKKHIKMEYSLSSSSRLLPLEKWSQGSHNKLCKLMSLKIKMLRKSWVISFWDGQNWYAELPVQDLKYIHFQIRPTICCDAAKFDLTDTQNRCPESNIACLQIYIWSLLYIINIWSINNYT